MEKLLDVLRANYGTNYLTPVLLQRRAGLTGLSGLLAGGGVGLAAGGVGGSFIGMALATYFFKVLVILFLTLNQCRIYCKYIQKNKEKTCWLKQSKKMTEL